MLTGKCTFLAAYCIEYLSRYLLRSVLISLLAAKCTFLDVYCKVHFYLSYKIFLVHKVLVKFISLSSTQTAAIVLGIFISPRLDSTLKENTLQNETLQYYSSHLLWAQKGDACCVVSLCVLVGSMPVCL